MTQTDVRAVWRNGVFVPLEPVELQEDTEVTVHIKRELTAEEVERILWEANLLEEVDDYEDVVELDLEERHTIGVQFVTTRNVEQDIREDRDAR